MAKVKEETGNTYGRLTVNSRAGSKNGEAMWLATCECGRTVIVSGQNLRNGTTRSCGCYAKEVQREIGKNAVRNNFAEWHNRGKTVVYDRPKRRRGRPTEVLQADIDRIIELFNDGHSYRSIRRYVDVSPAMVSRIIRANPDKLTREQNELKYTARRINGG